MATGTSRKFFRTLKRARDWQVEDCGDCGECAQCTFDASDTWDAGTGPRGADGPGAPPAPWDSTAFPGPGDKAAPGAGVVEALQASGVDLKASTSTDALSLYNLGYPGQPRWSEHSSLGQEIVHVQQMRDDHGIVIRIDLVIGPDVAQVEIQNTHMKKILASVCDGYPGFHVELLRDQGAWVFKKPFMIFAHRWEKLLSYKPDASVDAAAAKDEADALDALLKNMEHAIKPTLEAIMKIHKTGLVGWKSIPSILPPGHLAVLDRNGAQVAARIQTGTTKQAGRVPQEDTWKLKLQFVDWDGDMFGLHSVDFNIPWYSGYKHVVDLPTYPLSFVPDRDALAAQLTARGRKWEALSGVYHKHFDGEQIPLKGFPVQASGKIMVDTASYYESNKIPKPRLAGLVNNTREAEPQQAARTAGLTDEQCLMASGTVAGFDLKRKTWCLFPVEDVGDIVFNPDVFEKLVLPKNDKKLAWAFVKSRNNMPTTTSFDDFVVDKGRGLIMLLCGPPGVGKTFTAEAIAEKAQVPLYMMSAGELGTQPEHVDDVLDDTLLLCKKWQAMLLMDEADVFLGKRFGGGQGSLERNELVSIFLRRLEYYQGTMFLTTNQIENIDDAFQSRIDLILPYRELTPAARLQVWTNFIAKSGGGSRFDLGAGQVEDLALKYRLNGREIKNLVKSALLVAGSVGDDEDEDEDEEMTEDVEDGSSHGVARKVTMETLATLADLRVQVHQLMGKAPKSTAA